MHNSLLLSDGCQLVALAVKGRPKKVFEFCQAIARNSTYEDMRQVIRQVFREHLLQFVIEEVALRDGKNPLLVEHLGIEVAQFAKQHLIFMLDIICIARYHEKQEGVAFDMTQEAKSQATAFGSAFDDARNVGHHEALSISVRHDTERRFHGGEGIACNLWTSTR